MTNPLDISGTNIHNHRFVGLEIHWQMVKINNNFRNFIQCIPIYKKLRICLYQINYKWDISKSFNLSEKIFILAYEHTCWNLIKHMYTYLLLQIECLDKALYVACKKGQPEVTKFLIKYVAKFLVEYELNLQIKDHYELYA